MTTGRAAAMREPRPGVHDAGILQLPYLKRCWWRRIHRLPVGGREEWHRERVLIHGLGVGLEQLAAYFREEPSFAELEQWILERNGGAIGPLRIDRLRAALLDQPYGEPVASDLAAIEAAPDVLSAEDLCRWAEDGYVVVPEAIGRDECEAAAALVYETVAAVPDDPRTWYARRNMQGVMVQLFQDPRLQPARTSRRVHKAFAQLWGTADLIATTDRCGFNPPDNAVFTFPGPHLHWDTTLVPPVPFGVQGILYLTDTAAEQGAFTCIPGFHREIDAWLRALPERADPHRRIPHHRARPIAGRAGDLIIWHSALPHGSRPNRAAAPRVVQYVKLFPARLPRVSS